MVEFNRRCATCHHWQRDERDGAPLESGGCFWGVPPILSKFIDMLKSEPATHIDYKAALFDAGAPGTHENYGCGAWMPRGEQVTQHQRAGK